MSTDYTVRLPLFEGPLDLLLHLIEERELDITKVSLAKVTDQYLEYISQLDQLEPEKLADFLIIAAKLLLIKSRMLLPHPPSEPDDDEEDVGDDLVRRLIEYRRFKGAAQQLQYREEQGMRAHPRLVRPPQPQRSVRLDGVSLDALLEAVRQAMVARPASSADEVVAPLRISLPEKIANMENLLALHQRFSFNRILEEATSRMEIIVTFLALLQLMKRRKVVVEQTELFGDILVSAAD